MFYRTLSLIVFAAAFLLAQRSPFPPHTRGSQEVRGHEPTLPAEGRPSPGALSLQEKRDSRLAVATLLAALTADPDPRVREHAATALGTLGDDQASLPLAEVLLNDPNPRVREHAAEALGALGDLRSRDALLLAILTDSEPRVREHAAEALGMMGG